MFADTKFSLRLFKVLKFNCCLNLKSHKKIYSFAILSSIQCLRNAMVFWHLSDYQQSTTGLHERSKLLKGKQDQKV